MLQTRPEKAAEMLEKVLLEKFHGLHNDSPAASDID